MEQWFFPGPQKDIDAEGRVGLSPYPTLYSHHCSQLPATEIRHFLDTGKITSHNSRQDPWSESIWILIYKAHHIVNLHLWKLVSLSAQLIFFFFLVWVAFLMQNVFSGFPYKILISPFGSVHCVLGHVNFPCGHDWLTHPDKEMLNAEPPPLCRTKSLNPLWPHITSSFGFYQYLTKCIVASPTSLWECHCVPTSLCFHCFLTTNAASYFISLRHFHGKVCC